ncbi:hypothetical protein DFP72DRAFT_921797 [Ephemerocybe angulata]|uniref:DUF7918 domain-containing protein n=1 Tax=Ephemerocybe angulata TaxID=980116 RepID=A0A8H6LWS1_9AGAR|nr:hypothetical protein DFP72DRAFT_921797 [Tulosesus angulatus]
MPKSPQGVEAWIEVDGKRVDEYRIKQKRRKGQRKPIECYIPCEAGKRFQVVCSLPPSLVKKGMHMITVEMDGFYVYVPNNDVEKNASASEMTTLRFEEGISCRCMRPFPSLAARAALEKNEKVKTNFAALEIGWCSVKCEAVRQTFHFEALEITDDDAYIDKPTCEYGIIGLRIYSVAQFSEVVTRTETGAGAGLSTGWFSPDTITLAKIPVPEDEERDPEGLHIHESAKNDLTHGIAHGVERPNTKRVVNLKPEGIDSICNFFFHYRHMELLKANGIAPSKEATASTSPDVARPRKRQQKAADSRDKSASIPRKLSLRSATRNGRQPSSSNHTGGSSMDDGGTNGEKVGSADEGPEEEQSPLTNAGNAVGADGGELENPQLNIDTGSGPSHEARGDQFVEQMQEDAVNEAGQSQVRPDGDVGVVKEEEGEPVPRLPSTQGQGRGEDINEHSPRDRHSGEALSGISSREAKIRKLEEKLNRRKLKVERDQDRLDELKRSQMEDGRRASGSHTSEGTRAEVARAASSHPSTSGSNSVKRGAESIDTGTQAPKRAKRQPTSAPIPEGVIDLTLD